MSAEILVLGAGKSATSLIDYLLEVSPVMGWTVRIADNDASLAAAKTNGHPNARPVGINLTNDQLRTQLIEQASIVISMLPPSLHYMVALDCLQYGKHLLTASYIDNKLRELEADIKSKGLLFLCEMGLDPGIDHMSAMELIHRIREKENGTIISFVSHCGGLVAPESDDNPWHYKISWNPRNVVMAGKTGAVYLKNGNEKTTQYEDLFDSKRLVSITGLGELSWYPNRDSLSYISLYGLQGIETFIRTTLRYPQFCEGWQQVIRWRLTDEQPVYETNGMSLMSFFVEHASRHGLAKELNGLSQANPVLYRQLQNLGLEDDTTKINRGLQSAADVMQFSMEKNWALKQTDRDMVVMLHEIEYISANEKKRLTSQLLVKGEDSRQTAMAKTVGLPLGIAASMIWQGKIKESGLKIPTSPRIYELVLPQLAANGIAFTEESRIIQ